jgi:penicillin-binding protein 2
LDYVALFFNAAVNAVGVQYYLFAAPFDHPLYSEFNMSRDYERFRQFSRRALILGGIQSALTITLFGRLYHLQILESNKYKTLAEDNRINVRLLVPPRGEIHDRYGKVMALNKRDFRLSLIPEQSGSAEETIDSLSEVLQLSDLDYDRIMRDLNHRRSFTPVILKANLTWDEVALMELNNPDFPGTHIEVGQNRYYPYPEATSHVLGYVAAVSEADLKKDDNQDDPLLTLPDFRIGKKGVEKTYDERMRGVAGSSQMEVNAYGRVIRELATEKGQPGETLKMSLDIDIQRLAMAKLEGQSGSVVAMNAFTGEVIVLASAPGFDANEFSVGISAPSWEELISNPRGPLNNKALTGQYAPGSTFKVITALAALENGIVGPDHRVSCDGDYELGNSRFHCWKKGGHGTLDMVGGIRESCDVYFYDIANRMGIDKIADIALRMGLGDVCGIDISGEKKGFIPTRRWKQKQFNQPWQKGETLISGIGQGYVLATPLQLAVMAAHIANGGYRVKPKLILDEDSAEEKLGESLRISSNYLKIVQQGMEEVTSSTAGTARGAQIHVDGFAMAGKTGTSQVRRISAAERLTDVRKNEDLPWLQRDHALFIGYAPISDPKFVCSVVVEHGGGGSAVAAPIARDILLAIQQRARDPNFVVEVPNVEPA